MNKVIELLLDAKDKFLTFFQGICFSYEEGDLGEEYAPSERTRLLSDEASIDAGTLASQTNHQPHQVHHNQQQWGSVGPIPNGAQDDQAVLEAILHQMTEEILDVELLKQQMTVETGDLRTRSYQYGRRLQSGAEALVAKHSGFLMNPLTDEDEDFGLVDVPPGEACSDVILTDTDSLLISEVLARAKETFRPEEFRILNVEKIIASFNDNHDGLIQRNETTDECLR